MPLTLEPPAAKRQDAQTPDINEILALATHFIDLHFKGKSPDPSYDLYSMRFVKLVINSSIINSVHLIYDCMGIEHAGKKLRRRQQIDMLVDLYHQCARRGIPKSFATGLILMEYIVCKGIDILDEE